MAKKTFKIGDCVLNTFENTNIPLSPSISNTISLTKSVPVVAISLSNTTITLSNNVNIKSSKIGILIKQENILLGQITYNGSNIPLSFKCWKVFCNVQNQFEYWNEEYIIKL